MNSFLHKLMARLFHHPRNTFPSAGKSDPGKMRPHNEDFFHITPACNLFIVADGMGGHNAGDVASRMATETVLTFFSPMACRKISGNREEIQHALISSFHHANKQVMRMAATEDTCAGMGTTMVVGLIDKDTLHLCHIGDSRCYLADHDRIRKLTRDDTCVAGLSSTGQKNSSGPASQRHVLNRAIGFPYPEDPHCNSFPLTDGDKILLCSDGLWNMVEDRIILHTLRDAANPGQACDLLIKLANDAGGRDNITTVVIFYSSFI